MAGMWQSSAVGLNPMATKFTEYVTMSTHMVPEVASLNSWADIMEDPTTWMGSWSLASSGGFQWPPSVGYPHAWIRQFPQTLVGCLVLVAQTCFLWFGFLDWSGLLACHLGGGCGLWLSSYHRLLRMVPQHAPGDVGCSCAPFGQASMFYIA